jgi:hypothetical protein
MENKHTYTFRFRGFRLTQLVSILVYYFIQIIRYMFRSYDHLQVEIYTAEFTLVITRVIWLYLKINSICFNYFLVCLFGLEIRESGRGDPLY